MPLDPNIFLRGAALQQDNNNRLAQTIAGISDRHAQMALYKRKMETEAAQEAMKPENALMAGLIAEITGTPLSPEMRARAQAAERLRTSEVGIGIDGSTYQKNLPVLANIAGVNIRPTGFSPSQTVQNLTGLDDSALDSMGAPMYAEASIDKPLSVSQLPETLPVDSALLEEGYLPEVAPKFNDALPKISAPSSYSSPKQKLEGEIAADKANIEIQTEAAKKGMEKRAGKNKAEAKLMMSYDQAKQIDDTIDRAIPMVSHFTAGYGGDKLKDVAGTPAKDLEALLTTIKADSAFSELQSMRDNSPSGGALGSTTERELDLLAAAKASLDQAQSPKQLQFALENYQKVRQRAFDRVADAFEKDYGYRPKEEQESGKPVSWEEYFR